MPRTFRRRFGLFGAVLLVAVSACSDTATPPPDDGFDATQVLSDVANDVIFPTYQDLELKAEALNV